MSTAANLPDPLNPTSEKKPMSTIGIIGAGTIGRAIATILARHDVPAVLSNSRGPDSLKEIVSALGPSITAGTREEAAAQGIQTGRAALSSMPTTRSRRPCSSLRS
jgi:3-hydroxyacyl-CoA dehydrogenase